MKKSYKQYPPSRPLPWKLQEDMYRFERSGLEMGIDPLTMDFALRSELALRWKRWRRYKREVFKDHGNNHNQVETTGNNYYFLIYNVLL